MGCRYPWQDWFPDFESVVHSVRFIHNNFCCYGWTLLCFIKIGNYGLGNRGSQIFLNFAYGGNAAQYLNLKILMRCDRGTLLRRSGIWHLMMFILSCSQKSLGEAFIIVYLYIVATVFRPESKRQHYEWNCLQDTGEYHFLYVAHTCWRLYWRNEGQPKSRRELEIE